MTAGVPIVAGTRVRIRHKHAAYEGEGMWGVVRERRGKHIMVLYDGYRRARQEHIADVVERTTESNSHIQGKETP